MNRISGPMAVLAGLALMIPGVFAMIQIATSSAFMPGWMIRDLILCSLSGAALMIWGASHIRNRELELHDLTPIRIHARR